MGCIFGIYNPQQTEIDFSRIKHMQEKLSYWKVDQSALKHFSHIGLGQLILRTNVESERELPLATENNITVGLNGRIDNREEVHRKLSIKEPLRSIADGLLVLRAYEQWGEDCAKQLTGEFVFVIWDGNKQELYCAKDHLGIRPFYYAQAGDFFVFSSEIKGIFASGLLEKELNPLMLAAYAVKFKGEKVQTSFKKVFSLSGGHWLKLSKGQIKIQKYWELDYHSFTHLKSNEAYEERFRFYLKQAVQRRSHTNSPIGILLSGGLDSNAILGTLLGEKLATSKVFAYSWVHSNKGAKDHPDDREYVQSTLRMHRASGMLNHFYLSGLEGYFPWVEKLQPLHDEYVRDVEHFVRFQTYDKAQHDQVKTILSGVGGDHLGSSHAYHCIISWLLQLKWLKMTQELIKMKKRYSYRYPRLIKKEILRPMHLLLKKKEPWGRGMITITGDIYRDPTRTRYLSKGILTETNLAEFVQGHNISQYLPNPYKNPQRSRHWLNLNSGSLDIAFNQSYSISLQKNLQYNYPFLDKNFIEYVFSLPNDQFLTNGYKRGIIRRSISPYVPTKVATKLTKFPAAPNVLRRIQKDLPWLLRRVGSWKKNPMVSHYLNVIQLEQDILAFQQKTRSISQSFKAAINLGIFLEYNSQGDD